MGQTRRVRDAMTEGVATLERNDELTLADDIMRLGRIRHLPVLDGETGELVGIVSGRDLYQSALLRTLGYGSAGHRRVLKTLRVKEVMSSVVRTTSPDAPLAEAAAVMLKHKLGCLPVVEDGKLIGILTESDFVRLAAAEDPGS